MGFQGHGGGKKGFSMHVAPLKRLNRLDWDQDRGPDAQKSEKVEPLERCLAAMFLQATRVALHSLPDCLLSAGARQFQPLREEASCGRGSVPLPDAEDEMNRALEHVGQQEWAGGEARGTT